MKGVELRNVSERIFLIKKAKLLIRTADLLFYLLALPLHREGV